MGKLHQVLAVETNLQTTYKKILDESVDTFSKKDSIFSGSTIRSESQVDAQDPLYKEWPDKTETVSVVETVKRKLLYVLETAGQYFDAVAQKDDANTKARANLIVDGKVLLVNVPAVTLLFIENKMRGVRAVVEAVKTRDPAKSWTPAQGQTDIWMTPESSKAVKEPVEKWLTITQPTDKHPAQTAKTVENVTRVIKYTTELSGLISTNEKHELLKKIDNLINSAKKARQTANDVDVSDIKISEKIISYLMS